MKNLCNVLSRLRRVCPGVTLRIDEHHTLRRHRDGIELLTDGKRSALIDSSNSALAQRKLTKALTDATS